MREKIKKLLENNFVFILFLVGDQIKENYFFLSCKQEIFRIFFQAKTTD